MRLAAASKQEAPEPPIMRPQRRQVLVLLDMNGTVLVRSKKRLGRAPDAKLNDVNYYLREHASALVDRLLSNVSVVLAFYTSMRESSARPAITALSGGRDVELYEREFNKVDPLGENHWDTMRDLEKIWGTLGKAGAGFDATNTIVVEDTERKMREHPHNVIVVPSFTEDMVGLDDALRPLAGFLEALLAAEGDVRDFLVTRVFAGESQQRPASAQKKSRKPKRPSKPDRVRSWQERNSSQHHHHHPE
ncbi:hypothetical protein CTAYLR_008353 [Chrysophaeum taylorii]|uniref:Mitochondrial import inner membrane translocase subunit TIM50 n=1 Tax=Chrysophaeum taylorii TaxID=2483200 RepID=A0AAD7UDL4_9STRA|nr:hypothetical protein CTAYLR_008353 [Chrysophaeum taylorii]